MFESTMKKIVLTGLALALAVVGCKKQPATGEAFLVLRSDEVVPLADMEIVFIDSSFGRASAQIKQDYEAAKTKATPVVLAATQKFQEMDKQIQEMENKITTIEKAKAEILRSVPTKAKAAVEKLRKDAQQLMKEKKEAWELASPERISALNNEIAKLEKELTARKIVDEDYQKIANVTALRESWEKQHGDKPFFDLWTKIWIEELEGLKKQISTSVIPELEAEFKKSERSESYFVEILIREAEESAKRESSPLHEEVNRLKTIRAALLASESADALDQMRREFVSKFRDLLSKKQIQSCRTGKDGSFAIPHKARYLYASRERQTGESCHWLLDISNVKEPVVRLSNSNITSKEGGLDEWVFDVDWTR